MKSLDIVESKSLMWEQPGKLASLLVADVEISGASASKRDVLLAILSWYVAMLISDCDYHDGESIAAVIAASGT